MEDICAKVMEGIHFGLKIFVEVSCLILSQESAHDEEVRDNEGQPCGRHIDVFIVISAVAAAVGLTVILPVVSSS